MGIQNLPEHPPTLFLVQYHLTDIQPPRHTPIRKHHIHISLLNPPFKILFIHSYFAFVSLLLYSIRMHKVYFNISIIHVNYSMHILPPPALRHKDRNLQPAPVLDLTVFYKRPDWYLM